MKFTFSLFLITLAFHACAHKTPGTSHGSAPRAPSAAAGPMEFASQKLLSKGISKDFLAIIRDQYREDQRDSVIELNVLGFLRANRNTGLEKIPQWELNRVQKFLKGHRHAFREAEREFRVPKEVIASLLWVETRHGKNLGTYHVASSLFSLVQADYPTFTDRLFEVARQKAADYDKLMEVKIMERSRVKSDWAATELLALQEIHQKGWKNVRKLNGSFSGAFGMAQFLPSSYLTWAKGKREKPNLFQAEDSILSVANYLNSNGWKTEDRSSQEGALFHYNRDKSYVNHILYMSECLKKPAPREKRSKRATASSSSGY